MLKIVKKITLLITLLFTLNVANAAEPGIVDVVFRGIVDCSNRVEQISFSQEKGNVFSIIVVNEYGKKILNEKQILLSNSQTIGFNVPCGNYQIIITNIKTGSTKNYPILMQ